MQFLGMKNNADDRLQQPTSLATVWYLKSPWYERIRPMEMRGIIRTGGGGGGGESSLAEWQGGNKAGSYCKSYLFTTIGEVNRYIQVPIGTYR